MEISKQKQIIRELAERIAEIAYLPVQDEKRKLWRRNNDLMDSRPMVYIDQLPWHEIGRSEEMRLYCTEPFLRELEQQMKELLYRWNHFPCDMVVEKRIDIPYSVRGLNYGINIVENILKTDADNDIVSHQYEDQVADEEGLDKLENDKIWVDMDLDDEHLDICEEIFGDILPTRLAGVQIHSGVWDRIAQMRPAEHILWDLIDRPEFTEKVVKKFVDLTISTVEQCEKLGILDPYAQYIHCTGAYTRDLPKDGLEEGRITAKNVWSLGMSQIFGSVSPAMHEEFEIDLVKPLYEKFGLMYYGCCEPLENKIDIIRKINNVRKISISPWADPDRAAPQMGKDYVMSLKSNPAFIATNVFDEENIRKQIQTAGKACRANGTPLEIILKDVSTVSGHLEWLDRWNRVVMENVL